MARTHSTTGRLAAFFCGLTLAASLAACGGSGGGGGNAPQTADPAVPQPPPGVTVSKTALTTTEAGGTDSFTVVLDSQPSADVTISVSSSDTTEGTVAPTQLTFTSANWNSPQTVTVSGVDDYVDDGDIAYTVTLAAASSDTGYDGIAIQNPAATNTDDDTAGFTVSPTGGLVVVEGDSTHTASFTVRLDSEPVAQVVVAVASSKPGEADVDKTALTFDASNWSQDQTVTVTGKDNSHEDGDRSLTIQLTVQSSADSVYAALNPADVGVTCIDLTEPYSATPAIASGVGYTVLLASNGTVWGWGGNSYGEICAGDTNNRSYPVAAADPDRTGSSFRRGKAVTAGSFSTLILRDDGKVYGCGQNIYHQLGITGDNTNKATPTLATALAAAGIAPTALAAGDRHTLAVNQDGAVYAWGLNTNGQLGDGSTSTTSSATPVLAAGALTNVTAAAVAAGAGASHSVGLDTNGKVYTWGSDSNGQLGNGAATGDVTQPADISTQGTLSGRTVTAISSRHQSVMALDSTGQAHAWGRNDEYQLGAGNNTTPTAAPVATVSGVSVIYAGMDKGAAIDASGNVKVWGDNDANVAIDPGDDARGQLGTGDTTDRSTPTTAAAWGTQGTAVSGGNDFTVLLNSDSSVLTSGENNGGTTLGRDTSPDDYAAAPGQVLDKGYSGAAPADCSTDQPFYANRPVVYGYPVGTYPVSTLGNTLRLQVGDPGAGGANAAITGYCFQTNSGAIDCSPSNTISAPISLNLGANQDYTVRVWGKHQDGTVDCSPTVVTFSTQ